MTQREEAEVIAGAFEEGFLRLNTAEQVRNCDAHELAPWFRKWLPGRQPILEAGAGSGQWVAWCREQGWNASGLDWSEKLCAHAARLVPQAAFVAGDMRAMPWKDASFGSILSLGSIEHASEGPMPALKEYHRVLRPGGVAIITVPHCGVVRKARRFARSCVVRMRRLRGDEDVTASAARREWAPDFMPDGNAMAFFQYNFTRRQMRRFLAAAGLSAVSEAVRFHDDGIFHNFGRIAGRYCDRTGRIRLSRCGRILRRLLPVSMSGHMLCYVARRPEQDASGMLR